MAIIDFKALTLNAPLTCLGNASGRDCYYLLYNIRDRSIYTEAITAKDHPGEIKYIAPSYLLYKGRLSETFQEQLRTAYASSPDNDGTPYDNEQLLNALNDYTRNIGESQNVISGLCFNIIFHDTFDRHLYSMLYEGGKRSKQEDYKLPVAPQYLDQMTDNLYKDKNEEGVIKVRQDEHIASVVEITRGTVEVIQPNEAICSSCLTLITPSSFLSLYKLSVI